MENKNELSFDGAGINGPNTYRDRVATFNLNHPDWVKKYGPMFAAAPELLEIVKRINWAFYVEGTTKSMKIVMAETKALIAKAEGR